MIVRCPSCDGSITVIDPSKELNCTECGTTIDLAVDCDTVSQQTLEWKTDSLPDRSEVETESNLRMGHFILKRKLGAGAFGTVWLAEDSKLGRKVAVKIPRIEHISQNEMGLFIQEARAAAQLNHPNIVSVHEAGREANTVYIVSDYIEGVTLSEYLAETRIKPREAAKICGRISAALEHAHERGIIHRDLKPGNILIDEKGEPHIMDFGLARQESAEQTVMAEGQLIGTPAYMPPEQATGDRGNVGPASDLYSVGVILFEMLTGERPFRGNREIVLQKLLSVDPPRPRQFNRNVPKDLETICLRCLEKKPVNRPASAEALSAEFTRFLEHKPIYSRPISRFERAYRWYLRYPVAATLSVSLLAVIVTSLIVVTALLIRSEADRYRTMKVLADSWTRIVGATPGPVSEMEMVTLDELAESDIELQSLYFQQLMGSRHGQVAILNRPEIIANALVGSQEDRRQKWVEFLRKSQTSEPTDRVRELAGQILLDRWDARTPDDDRRFVKLLINDDFENASVREIEIKNLILNDIQDKSLRWSEVSAQIVKCIESATHIDRLSELIQIAHLTDLDLIDEAGTPIQENLRQSIDGCVADLENIEASKWRSLLERIQDSPDLTAVVSQAIARSFHLRKVDIAHPKEFLESIRIGNLVDEFNDVAIDDTVRFQWIRSICDLLTSPDAIGLEPMWSGNLLREAAKFGRHLPKEPALKIIQRCLPLTHDPQVNLNSTSDERAFGAFLRAFGSKIGSAEAEPLLVSGFQLVHPTLPPQEIARFTYWSQSIIPSLDPPAAKRVYLQVNFEWMPKLQSAIYTDPIKARMILDLANATKDVEIITKCEHELASRILKGLAKYPPSVRHYVSPRLDLFTELTRTHSSLVQEIDLALESVVSKLEEMPTIGRALAAAEVYATLSPHLTTSGKPFAGRIAKTVTEICGSRSDLHDLELQYAGIAIRRLLESKVGEPESDAMFSVAKAIHQRMMQSDFHSREEREEFRGLAVDLTMELGRLLDLISDKYEVSELAVETLERILELEMLDPYWAVSNGSSLLGKHVPDDSATEFVIKINEIIPQLKQGKRRGLARLVGTLGQKLPQSEALKAVKKLLHVPHLANPSEVSTKVFTGNGKSVTSFVYEHVNEGSDIHSVCATAVMKIAKRLDSNGLHEVLQHPLVTGNLRIQIANELATR